MAEVLLLSLPRTDVLAAERAHRHGDQETLVWLEGLFEPYRDRPIPCFLCDATIAQPDTEPLYSSIVGDLLDAEKCIAVPLCANCGGLPQMVKWSRVLKMLRVMHKARTGRDVHCQGPRH